MRLIVTTNLEKACVYLISKAQPSFGGKCGVSVRMAVDFGFSKNIEGKVSAKDYGPSYEKIGFQKVFSYPEMKKEDYKPEQGDICIIQYEPHGHICMKTSKGWISDFIQRDMYGGKVRDKNPAFDIYRYAQA